MEQVVGKNDGVYANPKQVKTDIDCRAARPKFDREVWRPARISDVTGGGLYLFVTTDESRPAHNGLVAGSSPAGPTKSAESELLPSSVPLASRQY
jgi:hypothetical protein